jgi:hypothetical protein
MPGFTSIRLFTILMGLVAGQVISASGMEQARSPFSIQTYEGIDTEDHQLFAMPDRQEKLFQADIAAITPPQNAARPSLSKASGQHAADTLSHHATTLHLRTKLDEGGAAPDQPGSGDDHSYWHLQGKRGLFDDFSAMRKQTLALRNESEWNNRRPFAPGKTRKSVCGNGICQIGENSNLCPLDCRRLVPTSRADLIADRSQAPRGARLPDGSLLVGVKRTLSNRNVIQALARDQLNGNWDVRGTVEENIGVGLSDLGNPMPFVDRNGRLLMAFRDHILSAEEGKGEYQLRIEYSDDKGHTWTRWDAGGGGVIDRSSYGIWEPFLYYDAQGELRVVYAKERDRQYCRNRLVEKQDIVTKVSRDGGKSWTDEDVVASAGLSRDGVPSVARLRDGSYVLVFESWRNERCDELNPRLVIRSMRSRDGVKWDKRSVVYMPLPAPDTSSGSNESPVASWPYAIRLRDGRLLVLFTTDENSLDSGMKLSATERSYDVKYMLTKNEASYEHIEWEVPQARMAYATKEQGGSIRYPSAVELDSGNVMIMFARPARYGILELR